MAKSCCGGSISKVKVKKTACCGAASASDNDREACGCRERTRDASGETPGGGDTQACACAEKLEAKWITGYIHTAVGDIPQVSTKLNFADTLGFWKCRWSIGRMDYTIEPGLYAVGTPDDTSHVLVTANYKMTFDRVREQLSGLSLWIVVLDTDGINVWCAAGKGTFGTDEVVNRVKAVGLDKVVSHRTLILPQLGATGVAAHEVKKQSGFRVVYGPIRAKDIKEFLNNKMTATVKMRTVTFTFKERAILTPVELVGHMPALITVFGILFILNVIGLGHYGIGGASYRQYPCSAAAAMDSRPRVFVQGRPPGAVMGRRRQSDQQVPLAVARLCSCLWLAESFGLHADPALCLRVLRDELYRLLDVHLALRRRQRDENRTANDDRRNTHRHCVDLRQ
jgi:hypothetical protein